MKFAALVKRSISIPAQVGPPGSDSRGWEPARTEEVTDVVEFVSLVEMKDWVDRRIVADKSYRLIQYDELKAVTTIEFVK
jgi:hypothetical protein